MHEINDLDHSLGFVCFANTSGILLIIFADSWIL